MHHKITSLKNKRKIVALTAYDYPTSKILNETNVDLILVGDSLGMVVYGYESTHFVTLNDMIKHTGAVMRGNRHCLVVADMPIATCETDVSAIKNCQKIIEDTGVKAVKIEGKPEICATVIRRGIPVLGHTGLKPQESSKYSLQGSTEDQAEKIFKEAVALEKAGCFALILECIPSKLAKKITEKLTIPTIGIGAGPDCDGQILVLHDMLGLFDDFKPKFVRQYANLKKEMISAVKKYSSDIQKNNFPSKKESY